MLAHKLKLGSFWLLLGFRNLVYMGMLLCVSLRGYTQPHSGIFESIPQEVFGDPQKVVKDIIRDAHGFLWLATTKGLFRYDGQEMRPFLENPLDSTSIGDNSIVSLLEDLDSTLWVGTGQGGVFQYDPLRETFVHFPPEKDTTSNAQLFYKINDMMLDHTGTVWLATAGGLGVVDRQRGYSMNFREVVGKENALSPMDITCLAEDSLHHIWVGTGGRGLYRFTPGTQEILSLREQIDEVFQNSSRRILDIQVDEEGMVWFTTENAGLFSLDPLSLHITYFPLLNTLAPEGIEVSARKIQPDSQGGFWLATHSYGLLYFSPEQGMYTLYQHDPKVPNTLKSNDIFSLLIEEEGVLWLGYVNGGVGQMLTKPTGFHLLPIDYHLKENRAIPSYRCIMEDSQGDFWIGTWGNGVYRHDPHTKTTQVYQHQDNNAQSLADNMIWDLLEDRNGYIWIATHHGLQRLDPKEDTFITYGVESGLNHEAIRSLWEDHTGKLWVGTFGGLHTLDMKTGRLEYVDDAAPIITDIFEDSQHHVWVATHGRGVSRWDLSTQEVVRFLHEDHNPLSLGSNTVFCVIEDLQHRIWLGTEGGGLNLFIPNDSLPEASTFRHWRTYNSDMPDDNITHISVDNEHRLWLSTNVGLFTFHTDDFQVSAYSLPGTEQGLMLETPPRTHFPLFVGNSQYIFQFSPDSVFPNTVSPPVYITEIEINGQRLPIEGTIGDTLGFPSPLKKSALYTNTLNLAHNQNEIRFSFSVLNYIKSQKNQYRYQLEGYDADWKKVTTQRPFAAYTNLSAGSYTFRVQGANNDGIWNEVGDQLVVVISSHWSNTIGAYLLYAILCIGVINVIFGIQLRRQQERQEAQKLREQDEFKTRFFTNITHEFRTPLTNIQGMATQIFIAPKQAQEIIYRNSEHLLRLVNQLLNLSKLEAGGVSPQFEFGNVIPFLKYLMDSFHSSAVRKQIQFSFLTEEEVLEMDYDPNKWQEILTNLISNALKFTPEGGQISLSISRQLLAEKEGIRMEVKDTGIGISKDKIPHIFNRFYQVDGSMTRTGEGTGIGLALVKEWVSLLEGTIEVESVEGQGTTFRVWLPITHQALTAKSPLTFFPEPDIHAPQPFNSTTRSTSPFLGEKVRVLIVEDNLDVVVYMTHLLGTRYELLVAGNGKEGIELAVEHIPDLIISDIMMPEVDGVELCKRLKADPGTRHIPILLLTAKVDIDSRLVGLQMGADAYLDKPFAQEELFVRLEALLTQRKRLKVHYLSVLGIPDETPPAQAVKLEASQEDPWFRDLKVLIEDNLIHPQNLVAKLSEEMAMSEVTLHRKLKALVGKSTKEVIQEMRLSKAKELLVDPDSSISDVAYRLGFSSPNYFSKFFKDATGHTPSGFRKNKGSYMG